MSDEGAVRIPDVEVIVSAAESEVGVVAFYFPTNPHEQVEVVAVISEAGAREHLVALLHQAIASFNAEDWYTLSQLDSRSVSDEGDSPPF